jgi:two-component system, cell cycle sensor histidine kinase and response regulator CckA
MFHLRPADISPVPTKFSASECASASLKSEGANARTILLVEDDRPVRGVLVRLLSVHGFRVLEAENAGCAEPLWRNHQDEIDLLLTDVVLPGGVSGCELARKLRQNNPALTVVFTSGYNTEIVDLNFEPRTHFIAKPYRPDDLIKLLNGAIELNLQN